MQGLSNFDGIASGLDTTQLVDAIITAERAGARLLEARQQQKTNELTTYSSLEALLLALKSEAAKLARSQSFDISAFTVSDNTVLDASAPGLVASAAYDIEVRKLAQAHQIGCQGYASTADVVGTGSFTVQVGTGSAVTVTLEEGANTLADLRDKINAAGGGVQASIINDGSTANAYRLVLSGKKSGLAQRIQVSHNLSGGVAPDFTTSRFDTPEVLFVDSATTARLSLGVTASYAGRSNKTYTFTVAGQGEQVVGQGEITMEWTDGTNSGTILVSQADTEVVLAGEGSEGLRVSFSAGALHGGDSFQVQAFSPQLQAAQDAEIAVGTDGSGASPLILRGDTNTLTGSLPGITLKLKKTTLPGEKVTITAGPAVDNLKGQVRDFVARYNDVMAAIDKQFTYNEDTGEVGTLLGDSSLLFVQNRLRARLGAAVDGTTGDLRLLSALGIRSDAKGQLQIDESKLDKVIGEDWEAVRRLFSRTGGSSNKLITFVSAAAGTRNTESGYDIDITQAATRGSYRGKTVADPALTPLVLTADNNTLVVSSDGLTSDTITLTAKSYVSGSELAAELQTKLNADSKLSGRGIKVEWVQEGNAGHLLLTSGTFGESSAISVAAGTTGTAAELLGLSGATAVKGLNVAGTINGESAKGVGQLLTGADGNSNTAGLVLKVELTALQLMTGAEGRITYTRGLAAALDTELESLTNAQQGFVQARRKGVESQIADIKDQIERFDARLVIRRNALLRKFTAMEEAIGQFQNQSTYLQNAIAALSTQYGRTSTRKSS
jgi:flagellar hook-associated protein 2